MRSPVKGAQFRRDVKLARKRGKDMGKLREVMKEGSETPQGDVALITWDERRRPRLAASHDIDEGISREAGRSPQTLTAE